MNNIELLQIPMISIIIISAVLKISNYIYQKRLKLLKTDKPKIELMKREISYTKFEEVSKEALTPNSPKRQNNDFLDFFIEHMDASNGSIQNEIMTINCGDYYE